MPKSYPFRHQADHPGWQILFLFHASARLTNIKHLRSFKNLTLRSAATLCEHDHDNRCSCSLFDGPIHEAV